MCLCERLLPEHDGVHFRVDGDIGGGRCRKRRRHDRLHAVDIDNHFEVNVILRREQIELLDYHIGAAPGIRAGER